MKKVSMTIVSFILFIAISNNLKAQTTDDQNNATQEQAQAAQPDPIMSALQNNIDNLNRIEKEKTEAKTGENIRVEEESVNSRTTTKTQQNAATGNTNTSTNNSANKSGTYKNWNCKGCSGNGN